MRVTSFAWGSATRGCMHTRAADYLYKSTCLPVQKYKYSRKTAAARHVVLRVHEPINERGSGERSDARRAAGKQKKKSAGKSKKNRGDARRTAGRYSLVTKRRY